MRWEWGIGERERGKGKGKNHPFPLSPFTLRVRQLPAEGNPPAALVSPFPSFVYWFALPHCLKSGHYAEK